MPAPTIADEARIFAYQCHAGQVHRDGRDAIEHPLRVAGRFAGDPALYAIAVLHDVLEDCPEIEFRHIVAYFGVTVALGVQALTRREGETWSHYIAKVKANPHAVLVKIADIEDNMARADEQFRAKMNMYETTLRELQSLSPSL